VTATAVHEIDPVIEAYKAGIDVTLIERNLRFTPEERLVQLMEMQRFAAELSRAGRVARPVT
jgi:hypothetical protein